MQHIFTIREMQARAAAVNLTVNKLARRAGLAHTTVIRRLKRGDGGRLDTHQKIYQQLEAEECRLLRHLIGIHGVPPPE